MIDFKMEISRLLADAVADVTADAIYRSVEVPPDQTMGDYAFPCFVLAKTLKKNPAVIAEELAKTINADFLKKVNNAGPYLNFTLKTDELGKSVLQEILDKKERFGSTNQGEGKRITIDFSSTNIAKPFHIGHLRSTVQGDALASIYEFLGFDTVRINYLGDYGTQFGMLIHAYEQWGDEKALKEDPIHELLRLYVKFRKEADENPDLMDMARERFYYLEQKREKETEIWQNFKDLSLREFKRVYDLLDIRFDSWDGEFYHAQFLDDVIAELEEKNLLVEDQGAKIITFDDLPPIIIIKSNGSSTYIARDIATALYRKRTYDFTENIYVVATEQNLHFRHLKAILKKMGYDWADDVHHMAFGLISLADGAMKTRSGNVLFLEDVLNQAIEKTKSIMMERNPDVEDPDRVAREVGIGAVKFQELFNNRIKDYVFNWEDVLNFDGETGPYVQYSAARCHRILERAKEEGISWDNPDFRALGDEKEHALLNRLYAFPQVVQQSFERKEPSVITRHITEIAKEFNKFYNGCSIFNAESEAAKTVRLTLCYAVMETLRIGLGLLGIHSPERM